MYNNQTINDLYTDLSKDQQSPVQTWSMDSHASEMDSMSKQDLDNVLMNLSLVMSDGEVLLTGDKAPSDSITAHPTGVRRFEHLPASSYAYAKKFCMGIQDSICDTLSKASSVSKAIDQGTDLTESGKKQAKEEIGNNTANSLINSDSQTYKRMAEEM